MLAGKLAVLHQIVIRYVTVYLDYDGLGRKARRGPSLVEELKRRLDYKGAERIYIPLPLQAGHTNHVLYPDSVLGNRIDPSVKDKMSLLVITHVSIIQKLPRTFIDVQYDEKELKPLPLDRSFYTTNKDIKNNIQNDITSRQASSMDQDNIQRKVECWKAEDPDRKLFFRPVSDSEDGSCEKFLKGW